MNEEKQELRYRQAGVAGTEWSVATTPDEFMQNGVYELKVINDNGTLPFPFRFAGDDIAKLIVSDSGTNDRQQNSRVVVQTITVTPSGTNKSVTYTRTRRNVNGNQLWSSWVEPEAASTANIYDGSVTAEKLSDDIRPNVVNPLRPLFIAAGAEYNDSGADKTKTAPWGETVIHKTGHYYLNGLGDITEEQMSSIYAANHYILTENISNIFFQSKIRTNICKKGTGWNNGIAKTSAKLAFYNSLIEVAVIANPSWPSDMVYCFQAGDVSTMFDFCNKLKRILGVINVQSATNVNSMLSRCPELLSVKVIGLCSNIIIKDSPNIEVGSIVYMIQNASPVSAITITLHPDAYVRLADDADIVAALEAQPLISLVSA